MAPIARLAAGMFLLLGGVTASGTAQAVARADTSLRVYLDCRAFCDDDYLRTELTYVDWVRDREDSDVHILVTSQGTGGGARAYSLFLLGRRRLPAWPTERTIFGKLQEVLGDHALTLSLTSRQPWDSARGSIEASTFRPASATRS
jgi:hypothetical protein